jgi:hypothetical protein
MHPRIRLVPGSLKLHDTKLGLIFATVENDCMVLIVRLAVPENWIIRKLNTELGSMMSGFGDKLAVAIDESRENPRVSAFLPGGLLFEVHDLKVRISAQ